MITAALGLLGVWLIMRAILQRLRPKKPPSLPYVFDWRGPLDEGQHEEEGSSGPT